MGVLGVKGLGGGVTVVGVRIVVEADDVGPSLCLSASLWVAYRSDIVYRQVFQVPNLLYCEPSPNRRTEIVL